jgi:hypothetical protein
MDAERHFRVRNPATTAHTALPKSISFALHLGGFERRKNFVIPEAALLSWASYSDDRELLVLGG